MAPSSDKAWETLLKPYSAAADEIPDDLLEAVASPLHVVADAELSFAGGGGDLVVTNCRWLRASGYCDALLSGRWPEVTAAGGEVPHLEMPCDR